MIDTLTEVIKTNIRGHKVFMSETVVGLYEICITLLRSDGITNPYTKAKALELMTMFVYSDQKKELMNDWLQSDIIKRFLMETTVQFYVDIEFAGQSMFYTKF